MRTHSIDYYRSRLRVDRNSLDDELEDHAELLEQISHAMTLANSAALRAKDHLSKVEARLIEDLKAEDSSLTAQRLDAKVRRHPERREAFDGWMRARENHEAWMGMQEAWKTRGFSIRNLSGLYSDQYFTLNSTQAKPRRSQQDYEQTRERMAEARQSTTRRRVIE